MLAMFLLSFQVDTSFPHEQPYGQVQLRLVFVLQHHNYVHPCKDTILKRRLMELSQEKDWFSDLMKLN